jgi:hypothetical protein
MSGGCVGNPIGFECAKPACFCKALFLGVIQDFLMNGHHSVRCLSAVPAYRGPGSEKESLCRDICRD